MINLFSVSEYGHTLCRRSFDRSGQWGDFHSFLDEIRMIVEDGSFAPFVPIELSDFFRVWWKEVRVALLCGTALAIVNYIRIVLQYHDWAVAMTVSLTLIVTVLVAKSLGCILPMLAKKLKLDPALMASPMLTTITDACSILVFFIFVMAILGGRL